MYPADEPVPLPTPTVRWRVREWLDQRGMSQAVLARRSGVPFQTISRMVSADVARHPTRADLETIARLARALNLIEGELFEVTWPDGWPKPKPDRAARRQNKGGA